MNLDDQLVNADWTKRTWDVYWKGELVTTLDDWFEVFKPKNRIDAIRHALTLPSATAMPARLRRQMEAYVK